MRRYIPFFALFLALFYSCTTEYKPLHDATIRYASLLQMENLPHERTLCRIANPWALQQTAIQYLLIDSADTLLSDSDIEKIQAEYGAFQLLRTPLQRQALTSSCHAWLIGQLEALDGIAVMCDVSYVIDSTIQQRLSDGKVLDGGSSMAPNVEVLLTANCDAIWVSPFENSASHNDYDRFQIPEIYCADYMETSPLARAEWMRFYGRLLGKAAAADSLFAIVENRYDSIARSSEKSAGIQQKLLSDAPYSGTWYVPGGCSTLGLIYQDAGFNFPWSNDNHAGSLALSPEAVFNEAQDADVWIIKYNNPNSDLTLGDFIKQHPLFPEIKAAKEGQVFGCNTAKSNYFDITPFRPDWLLEELVCLSQKRTDSLRFFVLLPQK